MKMIDVGKTGAMKSTYLAPEMAMVIFHCEDVVRTSSALQWNMNWSGEWEDHNFDNTNPIG